MKYTQRTWGEPWRWFISSEVLALVSFKWAVQYQSVGILEKPVPAHQSKGPEYAAEQFGGFEPLFLFSAGIFWSLDGPEKSSWQCRDFSGCRKQEGSKAAASKIKECDILEYLTAWKALLCPVLPFIFLSVSIWLLKLFLLWKSWSNLLLIKASISLLSVLSSWCSCELLCFQPLILAGL